MNDLGIAQVWLTLQVTAVALVGLVLSAMMARRTSSAGAAAALTALVATGVLAALACCPLPSWWSWDAIPRTNAASATDVATADDDEPAAARPNGTVNAAQGGGIHVGAFMSFLRSLARKPGSGVAVEVTPWRWPTVLAAVAGTGTVLGLLRLLLGLWAIRQSWRHSRPVNEPSMLQLVEQLQAALGVKPPVAVYESADLTTAATFGWRKPVLLLPPDWRAWTAEQRRAVAAHELAHVSRGDFAAWLLARLNVAVHFWHPLVRALAGQLQLQQELAADAVAAPLAGTPDDKTAAVPEVVVPFDLSLVCNSGDTEADGVYGVRVAAIMKRPGAEPMLKLLNTQIDKMTAAFKAGGIGIHVEDIEQVMGRVQFGGENKPMKRQLMLSLNMLRTTRDMDWVKLRDQCGPIMKQHQWKGETYVSFPMPPNLVAISGVKGDANLWSRDARTLIFDSESAIKAQIEAKVNRVKLAAPDYAAGWDSVSRGIFAFALNNSGRRIIDRTITEAELKAYLADSGKAECHAARFCQNASHIVVGVAGNDDFRFDLRASNDTPNAAAELAKSCKAFLAATQEVKNATGAAADDEDVALLSFSRKLAESAVVRRDGTVVTVHAEAASGFNALMATYFAVYKGEGTQQPQPKR
jgi:beta-lactamase regulating signal transducer with metallopeptidase domain